MATSIDVAQKCRRRIESLELWLRRLIHDVLYDKYGDDYLNYKDANGNFIIKRKIRDSIQSNYNRDPSKFSRLIDASLLTDSTAIVCTDFLYENHFKGALKASFDDTGNIHSAALLKNFCSRLNTRNPLSHANPISSHDAERILCITSDIIGSLKQFYRENGMEQEFNSPMILSLTDHLGKKWYREKMQRKTTGGVLKQFKGESEYYLHPGDEITIGIDVDSAFDGEYKTIYQLDAKEHDFEGTFSVVIKEEYIGAHFEIPILVKNINTEKAWTRLHGGSEDSLVITYKVFPLS